MRLRQYSTSEGFAKLLGCSASWIRNIECEIVTNWNKLAYMIEQKTQVSHKWLLRNPGPDDAIEDIFGMPWKPSRMIDPFGPRVGMPDWRELLDHCPDIIPEIIARMVEEQLRYDLARDHPDHPGRLDFLENIISHFRDKGTFKREEFNKAQREVREMVEKRLGSKLWGEDTAAGNRQVDHDQPDSTEA